MKTSEQLEEVSKALSALQGQIKPVQTDGVNPYFKSRYCTIKSIWDCIREPMTKNNLTILQDVTNSQNGICVLTRIIHSSGQWVEFGPLCVPLSKQDAHGIGSAISYAKRYALSSAIGVVSTDEDDDGNQATKATFTSKQKPFLEIIDHETWVELDNYLNGHDDLRKELMKKCSVNDLSKITTTQLDVCRKYAREYKKNLVA